QGHRCPLCVRIACLRTTPSILFRDSCCDGVRTDGLPEVRLPHRTGATRCFMENQVISGDAGLNFYLVGMTGFEPATLRSQSGCATKLRHIPVALTSKAS